MASNPTPPTAGSSTGAGPTVQNVDIRVPKGHNKKLAIMRFHSSMAVDFTKWSQPKIERENNQIQFKSFLEEQPKFGAGSEYGREAREEARRKKYGIISKKYKPEDQPWILQSGGKSGKKYRGVREGGVSENASYYVLTQAADGAFEAFPVQEWYNFQSMQSYKPLTYEEAEEEFTSRNRTFNLFNVMVRKRMKKNEDGEDDEDGEEGAEGKGKGKKKKSKGDARYGDEMDDMMDSSGESSDGDENEDEDDEGKKSKKKGKKAAKPKKKRKNASDDEAQEDSDDGDGEGRELDYISSSSEAESDLDQTKDDLKGVAEEEGLRKLLNSDEEDEDEEKEDENKEEDVDEAESGEEPKEGSKDEKDEKKKKKKKKKKDGKKPRKEEYGSSSDSDGDSSASELEKAKPSPKTKPSSANSSRSATPTKLAGSAGDPSSESKRKQLTVPEPSTSQAPKRPRLEMPSVAPSSSSAASPASSSSANEGVNEESVRRYLQRKPMTTTELLQKFKSKKTGLSSDQLVHHIAQILKKINPVKQTIKGKMYLSIKA